MINTHCLKVALEITNQIRIWGCSGREKVTLSAYDQCKSHLKLLLTLQLKKYKNYIGIYFDLNQETVHRERINPSFQCCCSDLISSLQWLFLNNN